MRLAVDVMGGDKGPEELLRGVKDGLHSDAALTKVYVVGPRDQLRGLMQSIGLTDPRVEVYQASEVLSMNEDPSVAIRRKKDSSMLRAIELVKEGAADAIISSGNTGALYAGGSFHLKRLEGVKRATIACIMPSKKGTWLLVDGGANPECTPEYLFQFGIMGAVYVRALLGIEKPRIGVLSNGSEEGKGTEITRAAVQLFRQTDLGCQGYCEGYDLFLDGVDICVCDGFVGNIVLKSSESLGRAIREMLREELTANPLRVVGAALAKGGLAQIRRRMNPEEYGGAPFLGLNGCVIKIHGRASSTALRHAMRQARQFVNLQLNHTIVRELARWAVPPAEPAPAA